MGLPTSKEVLTNMWREHCRTHEGPVTAEFIEDFCLPGDTLILEGVGKFEWDGKNFVKTKES